MAIAVFTGVVILGLVALCPLTAAISLFGFDEAGLSARGSTGTIWSGRLSDVRLGPVLLGDLKVGLRPLPLFIGRAELGVAGPAGIGRIVAEPSANGIENATAKFPLGVAFAPLPIQNLDLDDVSIRFRRGRCDMAEGRIHATLSSEFAGLPLASGLSGTARCDGSALVLPLVSQSAMERLILHIGADGRWRALVSVSSADPALATKLGSAGFAPTSGGYVLRFGGRL